MNMLRDAWVGLPATGKIALMVVVGGVLVSAMYFGVFPQALAWLSGQ